MPSEKKYKRIGWTVLESFGDDDKPDDILARMKSWVEKELNRKIGELEQIPF